MTDTDADALSFKLKLSQIIAPEQIDELLDLLGRPPCERDLKTCLIRSLWQHNPTSLGL